MVVVCPLSRRPRLLWVVVKGLVVLALRWLWFAAVLVVVRVWGRVTLVLASLLRLWREAGLAVACVVAVGLAVVVSVLPRVVLGVGLVVVSFSLHWLWGVLLVLSCYCLEVAVLVRRAVVVGCLVVGL